MKILARSILKLLAMPPGINILLLVVAIVLWRRLPRVALAFLVVSTASLWVFSTPFFVKQMTEGLEQEIAPVDYQAFIGAPATAIVIVGAGIHHRGPEYGGPTATPLGVLRTRYGAWLHKRTGLPILISGGRVFGEKISEAEIMAAIMEDEFGVPVTWVESDSRTTAENAWYTKRILEQEGIETIVLVSSAYHMQRALESYLNTGMTVIPAPTYYSNWPSGYAPIMSFVPTLDALYKSRRVLHEWLGFVVYHFKSLFSD